MAETDSTLLLTKLLPLFAYPLGLAILLLLIAALMAAFNRRWTAVTITVLAIALLWVSAMPLVARATLTSLERQYPPIPAESTPQADAAIVLGGALGLAAPPRVGLDLTGAADRVLHAAHLYRAGKVKRILVTGGNLPWLPAARPEAELIRQLLQEWGVPGVAIEIAGASHNTYENALEVRALREKAWFGSALLVTSAAHMPRALAVFRGTGLPVTPASTDVQALDMPGRTPLDWFPDVHAMEMTTDAIKEWIGLLVYRARGYLS